MTEISKIRHVIPVRKSTAMEGLELEPNAIKMLAMDEEKVNKLGIGLPNVNQALNVQNQLAMDSDIVNPVGVIKVGTPAQFLQAWLQGILYIMTVARKCDVLAPQVMVGSWEDQLVVQQHLERFGTVGIYKDHGDVPLTSWNLIYEHRDILRFELGMQIQRLEDSRANAMNVNNAMEKRASIALSFEMLRNDIFFHGYSAGGMRVYGMLNDPNMPNFVQVKQNASGKTAWAEKTVNEIISDVLTAMRMLRLQSGANIDPKNTPLVLALPLSVVDLLHNVDGANSYGYTVQKWLNENYPNIRVEAIPQFDKALGCPTGIKNDAWNIDYPSSAGGGGETVDGTNVFYLYAEKVAGSGTDDGASFVQLIPSKIQPLNTVMTMKGWTEGFTSAYAGCFVKRGYAITRFFGI